MEWLQYAANLNGQGVALCNGKHGDVALEYFKGSLEVMAWIAMNSLDDLQREEFAKHLPSREVSTYASSTVLRSRRSASGSAQQGNTSIASSDGVVQQRSQEEAKPATRVVVAEVEAHHFVFEKPLTFTAARSILTDPGQISFVIAVIEFNMAMCLHLQSRQLLSDKTLFSSLHVYDCCLEHIARSGCSREHSQLILFAALNNKAALLYEISSFQMAREVLKALSDEITKCKNTGFLYSIDDNDLEGFLFNVMLLKGVCVAPAA